MWHYKCVNLYNAFTQAHGLSYTAASLTLHQVWVSNVYDLYIDAVSVRRALPLGYSGYLFYYLNSIKCANNNLVNISNIDESSFSYSRRLFPNMQTVFNTLNVKKTTSNNTITMYYRPNNCSYNLNDVYLRQQFNNSEVI